MITPKSIKENKVGLLDVRDAASFLGIRPITLYAWVNQRRITYIKVGRLVKFDRTDLEEWILENKIKAI